jgi:hypothetical protein
MFLCGSSRRSASAILTMLQYATLPHDLAVKNMEIFAREVMGEIRKMDVSPTLAAAK